MPPVFYKHIMFSGIAMKNEIILYRPNELTEHIEVRIDEDTVWLTQAQMAELFQTTPQNITIHIGNVYKEAELEAISTCKDFLQVRKEGKRTIQRKTSYYNLDVIISVGYRVKSKQGTQFRIWATRVLKDYLLKDVYLFGASLKDLGKKLFGFFKMDKNSAESIVNVIPELILK